MTPDDYESVVAKIVRGIRHAAPELAAFTLGSGRRNKVEGASGYRHQIDVSLSGPSATYLIECKRWGTKIGVEEVMVLAARGTDIAQRHPAAAVHCTLTTRAGATRGAIVLANYFRIELEIVVSAEEFGMRIGKRIHVGLSDKMRLEDSISIEVTRNGKLIPE